MKLNALLKTLGFLALAATPVVAGTSAPAPKNPAPASAPVVNDDLGMNVGLGYHTDYIWRGFNYGQHWVNGTVGGTIPLMEGTRLVWDADYGSLASDQNSLIRVIGASYQRLQLGAALQRDFGAVTASAGYRYFRNMGANNLGFGMVDGNEFSVGLATALGPVNVATSANYDISNYSWYFDFDANTSFAVTDSISIVPFVNIGYGKNFAWQFASGANNPTGWTAFTGGIRLPIKLSSRATLTPYIAANVPMGPLGNALGEIGDSKVFGGVTLNVNF